MAKTKEDKKEELDLTKVKEELKDYVNLQINKEFNEELERTHNKLLRTKTYKIVFRDFIILILICLIGGLLYLLYTNNYFDKYFKRESINTNEKLNNNINVTKPSKENLEPTLEDLKEEYGYLLDDIIISENSIYLKDYYAGNLTSELKNYLAFNLVDFKDFYNEDDSTIIDNSVLETAYKKIFDGIYNKVSFDYNGEKILYIKALSSYFSDNILEKETSNIKREIINIELNNKEVKITTIEGIVKDNKLYNILTKNEVKKYTKNSSLKTYEEKLEKVIYTFENEKLESISK